MGGRYIGVTEFPNFYGQTSKHGLGYDPEKDTGAKKFISFIPEGTTKAYQGQTEKWKKEGVEIFKDVINSTNGKHPPLLDIIIEADIDELIKNLGIKSKVEILDYAEVTIILESSINDILFEDTTTEDDLCTFPLFETDDVMNSKFNAMKSDFAYLFDVFSNGSVHCID